MAMTIVRTFSDESDHMHGLYLGDQPVPSNEPPSYEEEIGRQDLTISSTSAFGKPPPLSQPQDIGLKPNSAVDESLVSAKSLEDQKEKEREVDLHEFLRKSQWKRLLDAIKSLQRSASPDMQRRTLSSRDEHGDTPLHTAVWKAPPRLALLLLELVPINSRKEFLLMEDDDGNTPLHLACANLDERVEFSVIKNMLLLAPESLESQNNYGDTPLHLLVCSPAFRKSSDFAVEAAAEEAITSLLMMVGHMATVQNNSGATLLHIAIGHGAHERVLVKLLSLGPSAASIPDIRGMLPVHYVAAFGGTPWTFVRQLMSAFPNCITFQTENGDTPLHLLMSNAKKNIKEDLPSRVDRNTTKLAELFVGSGDKIESPLLVLNKEHLSPLHCCALFDTPPQLTRAVMESPFAEKSSALTTQFGATALHLACASSRVAESLPNVEALATPEACAIRDFNNRTPLMVAVQNSRATGHIIRALTKAYPRAAAVASEHGFLPLHLAVQSSKVKESFVRPLLKAYPDSVYAVAKSGNTALHEACLHCAPLAVIQFLIVKNPSAMELVNDAGERPLECARKSKASSSILALVGGSAKPERDCEERSIE